MAVRTIDKSQIGTLQKHLDEVSGLDPDLVEKIGALAAQTDGKSVLPIVGAGASYDCGMRLASQIATDLLSDYRGNDAYAPHDASLSNDLGDVAEAIFVRTNQLTTVRSVGIDNSLQWPGASEIEDHFCAFRIFARLCKEKVFSKAFSFNFDCCCEAALDSEGFMRGVETVRGPDWNDHASVICDKAANDSTMPQSETLVLHKAHGCAEQFRRAYEEDPHSGAENQIIIRRDQVERWKDDKWRLQELLSSARGKVLMLIGFSGQDPRITTELRSVLEDLDRADDDNPRVVVIDREPASTRLEGLIQAGEAQQPAPGAVTQISTDGTTTTAVSIALLGEVLALRVEPLATQLGVSVPSALEERVATLVLAAPAMTRWSFLMRPSTFAQRTNAQIASERCYVPLSPNLELTVRALKARASLRATLDLQGPESAADLIAGEGFVVVPGSSYMPLGIGFDELHAAFRTGEGASVASALTPPGEIERVLVCEDAGGLRGLSLKGQEVSVP